MSAASFRSVFMVASCAGAALGCYLVSLRVASERAALEDVETKIVLAQRDIRVLQTEIGTRGRLAQLERWNVKVMALSAPTADQFLKGGFELARFTAPERKAPIDAPVVLASAPTTAEMPRVEASTQGRRSPLMHEASLKTAPQPKSEVSLAPRPQSSATVAQAKVAPKATSQSAPKAADKASLKTAASNAGKPAPQTIAPVVKPTSKAKAGAETKPNLAPKAKPKAVKSTARDALAPLPDSSAKKR